MVKVFSFLFLVLGIMFYPLFIAGGTAAEKKASKEESNIEIPAVSMENGKFYIYNGILEKKGDFKVLDMYKKGYIAFYLNVYDLIKNEEYNAYKTVFKNDVVTGYNVWYQNKDIKLKTKEAKYYKKTKNLNGGEFELYSRDFRGYGKKFKVDGKKNLYAEKITYYIKVEK